jgi:hypothetical protein
LNDFSLMVKELFEYAWITWIPLNWRQCAQILTMVKKVKIYRIFRK